MCQALGEAQNAGMASFIPEDCRPYIPQAVAESLLGELDAVF